MVVSSGIEHQFIYLAGRMVDLGALHSKDYSRKMGYVCSLWPLFSLLTILSAVQLGVGSGQADAERVQLDELVERSLG